MDNIIMQIINKNYDLDLSIKNICILIDKLIPTTDVDGIHSLIKKIMESLIDTLYANIFYENRGRYDSLIEESGEILQYIAKSYQIDRNKFKEFKTEQINYKLGNPDKIEKTITECTESIKYLKEKIKDFQSQTDEYKTKNNYDLTMYKQQLYDWENILKKIILN